MRSLTCILCPVSCTLEISPDAEDGGYKDSLIVTGNRCPRGVVYALEEIRSPKRIVTATAPVMAGEAGSVRRVPVKTATACPQEKIPALLHDIYKLKVSLPVKAGDVLIAGWEISPGEGINIIATRSIGNAV